MEENPVITIEVVLQQQGLHEKCGLMDRTECVGGDRLLALLRGTIPPLTRRIKIDRLPETPLNKELGNACFSLPS